VGIRGYAGRPHAERLLSRFVAVTILVVVLVLALALYSSCEIAIARRVLEHKRRLSPSS